MALFDYVSKTTTVLTLRLGNLTHANLFQLMRSVWPFFRKEIILNEAKWFLTGMLFSIVQAAVLVGYIIHNLKCSKNYHVGCSSNDFSLSMGA